MDGVRDEGDMFVQDNGEILEAGRMVNPATGREEVYEECWVDVEILEGDNTGWVARLQSEGNRVRGVVVRLGGWLQGFLRRDEECVVGRWSYDASNEEHKPQHWDVLVIIGDLELSESLFKQGRLEIGEKIAGKDGVWECIESWDWR